MTKRDRLLTLLKWPSALFSLFLLPGSLMALFPLARTIWGDLNLITPFLWGFAAYTLAWYLLLRRPIMGSAFSTLEHELTHALFALLSGHRVRGIRITWNSGGEMTSVGGYNWLIYIAPYFFPTFSVLFMLLLALLSLGTTTRFLFGATTAYHLLSTIKETHLGQTDLKRAGYLFSLLFLPTANLLAYTTLFAFAYGGWSQAVHYLNNALHSSMGLLS